MPSTPAVYPGLAGGAYRPLSDAEMRAVHEAALSILEDVGMGEAPDNVLAHLIPRGCRLTEEGRLTFPRALVEEVIAGLRRDIVLHGQVEGHELDLSGARVHMGSGGAAPSMVDMDTGEYRDSTLTDLYDAARVVDALDNIHFFSRSVVARDMPTPLALDVNTAHACLAGTAKHVMTSITEGPNVAQVAEMCWTIAGSRAAFEARPFLSVNINHVVPPLRFIADACAVIEQSVRLGLPIHLNSLGQSGASSPVTLAGSLVQAVVETLAGLVFAWVVDRSCRATFGPRPLITDLRTGAMTSGCGEQAVVMAGAVQMARFYDLPNSCIAGGTDAKIPDAQSGYEKAMTVMLAAQAGCNLITQAAGAQGSLMGCSLEAYVIDDDMLGAILRSLRGIEVRPENMAGELIAEVVRGEGHFLGTSQTYERMNSDYLYPRVADRRSAQDWWRDGAPEVREAARIRVREILETHHPTHLAGEAEAKLCRIHDIRLHRRAI